jgi:hypothetical protein
LIDKISTIIIIFSLPALFVWLLLAVFLSVKLRKSKRKMISQISDSAPKKFKERAKFMMESNISWVSASAMPFLWIGYITLKSAWKISEQDLNLWKKNIAAIINPHYYIYRLMFISMNICFSLFPILIFLISIS